MDLVFTGAIISMLGMVCVLKAKQSMQFTLEGEAKVEFSPLYRLIDPHPNTTCDPWKYFASRSQKILF
jgi:hypothetical protein